MPRGPLVWILAVVGVVLVLIVTALIGDRDDQGETVAAGEWAQNVCGAVGVWRGELEATIEEIRTPSAVAVAGEEPQSETPQGRTGLIRVGLERGVQATETMIEGVDNAGTPTAGGRRGGRTVVRLGRSFSEVEGSRDSLTTRRTRSGFHSLRTPRGRSVPFVSGADDRRGRASTPSWPCFPRHEHPSVAAEEIIR